MLTPGHTPSCVTVVAKNCDHFGTVAVAGDLFEREEDIEDDSLWISAGSFDQHAQRKNRLKVAELADYIVPGHGKMFKVTDEMRKLLASQVGSCA